MDDDDDLRLHIDTSDTDAEVTRKSQDERPEECCQQETRDLHSVQQQDETETGPDLHGPGKEIAKDEREEERRNLEDEMTSVVMEQQQLDARMATEKGGGESFKDKVSDRSAEAKTCETHDAFNLRATPSNQAGGFWRH